MSVFDSSFAAEDDELGRLISAQCDGEIGEDDRDRLAAMLETDREAKLRYAEFLEIHAWMLWRHREQAASAKQIPVVAEPLFGEPLAVVSESHAESATIKTSPVLRAIGRTTASLSHSAVWSVVFVALVTYGTFALIAWNLRPDKLLSFAADSSDPVAVVRDTTDVQWSKNTSSKPAESSILSGEPLKISSGTIELELNAGTKLVIEGPAEWSVNGKNSVSLRSGKLLAQVSAQAIGFTVETPTAKVVDLGTEFGVEVSESGATDVHVIRGAVEVARSSSSSTTSKQSVKKRLVAGQAIRVTHAGVGDVATTSNAKSTLRGETAAVAALDLVDIVAGGDGRGRRRDRGIDPATGRVVLMPDKDFGLFNHFLSGGYQRPDDRPFFIDGVGIPDPSHGPVQLNSAGHTFAGFPKTSGNTWGPLWAGGVVPDNPNAPKLRTTFDGKLDYSMSPHGLIALIPNKLITFDLAALRREHRRYSLVKFRTVAGLSKPVPLPTVYKEGDGLADVWVFIDGELRFSRLAIRSADDPFTIELPLSPAARFLTVATTDGGNTVAFDWVFFGDPQIELEVKEQK